MGGWRAQGHTPLSNPSLPCQDSPCSMSFAGAVGGCFPGDHHPELSLLARPQAAQAPWHEQGFAPQKCLGWIFPLEAAETAGLGLGGRRRAVGGGWGSARGSGRGDSGSRRRGRRQKAGTARWGWGLQREQSRHRGARGGVMGWHSGAGGVWGGWRGAVAGPLRVGLTFSSRTDPAYLAGRLLRDGRPALGAAALDRPRAHRRSARQPAHCGPDQGQQRLVSRAGGGAGGLLPARLGLEAPGTR